jgi:Glycosyltransferase
MIKKRLKIAVFVPWIKSKGGVERAMLSILKNSRHKIDIYTFTYNKENTFKEFKKFNVKELNGSSSGSMLMRGFKLFYNMLTTKIPLKDYDLFIISTGGLAELIVYRNSPKVPVIAITHTPLRIAHSMYDYYRASNIKYRMLLPLIIPIYRLLERGAWKKIDYSFVYSNEVRRRIESYGLMQSNRIFSILPSIQYNGIGPSRVHDKYFFYASRFTRYKRQVLAVKGFLRSGLDKKGFRLIVGGFVEDQKYLEEVKKAAGGNPSIEIKTDLSNEGISRLYRRCYATLFLAMNEDTGLVPLESLASENR